VSADDETTPDIEPSDGVEIDKSTDEEGPAGAEVDAPKDSVDDASAARQRGGTIPLVPVVLVLALIGAGLLAGWLYFTKYRHDQQTDDAVAQSAVNAARDGTVAILSYKPDTLNQDFAAARSHLTGDFLNYYDKFTKEVVTPAAQTKGVTTTAQVAGAAVAQLSPDKAVVLVFINQATTSKERPDPAMASSSANVSLDKVHGAWLISKFDPL
jgi:Mce-associated membrane protein